MKNFEDTTRAYRDALQWSDFQVAQAFLKIPSSQESPPNAEELKDIRIVNYEVRQAYPSGDKQRVRQVVSITYYRADESVLRKLTTDEVWEYDEPSERWFLSSGLPKFE
jgi:hypothetical protein